MSTQRLNINIGPETAEALKALDDEKGQSYTETVKRAVKLYRYIEQMEKHGWSIVLSQRGHEARQLTIL